MNIEVITLNKQDTAQAAQLGASRVELVSAMEAGGLTPSYGTLKRILPGAPLPVHVMVRPHAYGFVYDDEDAEAIAEDVQMIQQLGGTHIVFGCLTEAGKIDESLLSRVIELAPDMDITFHRAFDQTDDLTEAYHTLVKYTPHVSRILTSGGKDKSTEAANELKQLVALSEATGGPRIMPGSGINTDNLAELHKQVGAQDYHIGSGVRTSGAFNHPLDPALMDQVKTILGK
ncbi:Copper homeostasis protein cutC like protein [Lentibacillus sp. JNUCC-1]|uniref:copper homeostasis protein CutC n=1 Tax=Lentibacillus sp. JNUCC-1 TaxID=2654513 RepID=UPI0012E76142|nr:copper homeostasis protein CutC [Lentibacillus sp. JNUCC-1]MUV38634.1 Copper homeostasis protein cutC like protein [Lentibacillus sp. JNUCC-1]